MNEQGRNESTRSIPLFGVLSPFSLFCMRCARLQQTNLDLREEKKRVAEANERLQGRERESERASQAELPYSIRVGWNYHAKRVHVLVAAICCWFFRRSMIHSLPFVNSCIRWIPSMCFFFFFCFVSLLFFIFHSKRKWAARISSGNNCIPSWETRMISSRMNVANHFFVSVLFCFNLVPGAESELFLFYFSVDFLVFHYECSAGSTHNIDVFANLNMIRVCPWARIPTAEWYTQKHENIMSGNSWFGTL